MPTAQLVEVPVVAVPESGVKRGPGRPRLSSEPLVAIGVPVPESLRILAVNAAHDSRMSLSAFVRSILEATLRPQPVQLEAAFDTLTVSEDVVIVEPPITVTIEPEAQIVVPDVTVSEPESETPTPEAVETAPVVAEDSPSPAPQKKKRNRPSRARVQVAGSETVVLPVTTDLESALSFA